MCNINSKNHRWSDWDISSGYFGYRQCLDCEAEDYCGEDGYRSHKWEDSVCVVCGLECNHIDVDFDTPDEEYDEDGVLSVTGGGYYCTECLEAVDNED